MISIFDMVCRAGPARCTEEGRRRSFRRDEAMTAKWPYVGDLGSRLTSNACPMHVGKRVKMTSFSDDQPDPGGSCETSSNPEGGDGGGSAAVAPERRFRGQRVETPSHPGKKA